MISLACFVDFVGRSTDDVVIEKTRLEVLHTFKLAGG
jgi:hypothetical protein